MRWDLVEKVLNDLKGIVPYKENIVWEDFKSIRTLGRYYVKENKIVINEYLEDPFEIMETMAHELIHAAGVNGHRKEFKEYMNKINALNLGYYVSTHYKSNNPNSKFEQAKRDAKAKRNKSNKSYIVWCECCGWNRIYHRKSHKLRDYCCPKCCGKLRQKQYKPGKTEIKIYLH